MHLWGNCAANIAQGQGAVNHRKWGYFNCKFLNVKFQIECNYLNLKFDIRNLKLQFIHHFPQFIHHPSPGGRH